MCDVVGRLLSSCISHLVGRHTTNTEEDSSCDPEYNTEATRYDEQPLPLSMEIKNAVNGLKEGMKEMDNSVIQGYLWTAIEPGKPKEYGSQIKWEKRDDTIRSMQAERMSKDAEIPSMWNYDPRCLAKEFVGLDQKSFLVDPSTFNICFLDKDILRKISKMLTPMDFLNLSYTCRFLHWRLFTFCTCYAPYTVFVEIRDVEVGDDKKLVIRHEEATNKTNYTLRLDENDRQLMPHLITFEGHRAVVARIPSCLRRPFVFDKLIIRLFLPFFTKDDFDRCLSFTLPVHKYGRHLRVDLYNTNRIIAGKFYDYQAVNDFLQAVNASSYFCYESFGGSEDNYERALKVFENCPYTRVMDTSHNLRFDNHSKWENLVLLHRIGHYINPPMSTIIRTIEEFKYGAANLDYHEYEFRDGDRITDFLKYFYANYDEIEEYHCQYESLEWESSRFVTISTQETGRRHKMKVNTLQLFISDCSFDVTIGKEDIFRENLKTKIRSKEDLEDCKANPKWHRVEKPLEPLEADEEETAAGNNAS